MIRLYRRAKCWCGGYLRGLRCQTCNVYHPPVSVQGRLNSAGSERPQYREVFEVDVATEMAKDEATTAPILQVATA